jgi:hypothetical protein
MQYYKGTACSLAICLREQLVAFSGRGLIIDVFK